MKKVLLHLLILATLFSCACASEEIKPAPAPAGETAEAAAEKKPAQKKEPVLLDVSEIDPILVNKNWDGKSLKVLCVGNSFARNATKVLYQIAKREGVEEIVLGNLHIGGCPISRHYELSQSGAAEYAYYKNTTGTWEKTENVAMMTALLDEDWDVITITSTPGQEGFPECYVGCLDGLIAFLRANMTNPDAQIGYHMSWAFPSDSPSSALPKYGGTRRMMYDAIMDTTENHIMKKYDVDFLLPTGTAVENARSILGESFCAEDGYHLNSAGEYVAGYMFFASITGKPLTELKMKSTVVTESSRVVIAKAVNAALHQPFNTTDISE
ncbi:MAG: DUF4886 domain-containing protein [Ruminococcaceae bacterium]|nr:DUF4886 domain-containing protein [Oscillospiraceae bacterium]